MSQLVLHRGTSYRRKIFRKFVPSFEFGPYFLVVSLVIFVILITVITLTFSTRQVTKGYVLNKMESEHQSLIKENEVKDMQISQVRSLQYIQNSSKARSMQKPRGIVFISGDSAIASK